MMSTDPLPQSAHARTSSQPPSHSQSVRRECRQLGVGNESPSFFSSVFLSFLPSFAIQTAMAAAAGIVRAGQTRETSVGLPVSRLPFGLGVEAAKKTPPLSPFRRSGPSLIERTAGLLDRRSSPALWSFLLLLLDLDINTTRIIATALAGMRCGKEIDIRINSANTEQSCRKPGHPHISHA